MSRFVRASKVRHVFCDAAKDDKSYKDLKLSTATGDHNYIKANCTFFAIPYRAGGGGALAVIPLENYGKLPARLPLITGHTSKVLDFDFNPFHENIIASGSDDTTVKVWGIPDGGLTEHIHDPLVDLHGHMRKVSHLSFHPTAEHVLCSTSSDFSLRVWDIEKASQIYSVEGFENLISDQAWSYDGSTMTVSCKDKALRVYDVRAGSDPIQVKAGAHEGSKTVKICYLGTREKIVSVGFTRQSKRQFKIWDYRNMENPICSTDIDQAAGVIMPFYDTDTNLLFLAGKGDGNIRFYEMVDAAPWQFGISEYRSSTAAKGACMLPKRSVDTSKCEVVRMLKLTSNSAQPLHFIIPRKSDVFQPDVYPDAYAGKPAMTSDEWAGGKNAPPPLMSMDPANRAAEGGEKKAFVPMKSAAQLQRELDAANAKIAELEAELAALKA